MNGGDAQAGRSQFDSLVKSHPDSAIVHYFRAIQGFAPGSAPSELEDLDRALSLRPDYMDALVARSSTWRRLGKPELARQDADRAVRVAPTCAVAEMRVARCRFEQGELDGAIEEYTRTIRLIDQRRDKSAPETPAPALAPSAARIESLGATVNASAALSGRAAAYLAKKDTAHALVDAERAVRLALEDEGGFFRIAVVKNALKFSFNINSDRYWAFLVHSRVQSALGNLDLAREDARQAIGYARTDDERREASKLADSLGK